MARACADPSSPLSCKLRILRCTAPGEATARAAAGEVETRTARGGNFRQGGSLSNSRGGLASSNHNGSFSTSTTPLKQTHVSNTPALLPGGGFRSDTPDPPRWWERQAGSAREINSPLGGGVDATVVIAGRDGVEATMLAEVSPSSKARLCVSQPHTVSSLVALSLLTQGRWSSTNASLLNPLLLFVTSVQLKRRQDRLRGMHGKCEGDGGQDEVDVQRATSGHHRPASSEALPYC